MPQQAIELFADLLSTVPMRVIVKHGRIWKKGDFRPKDRMNDQHQITINAELNPYAFTITFAHELAHLFTVQKTRSTRNPHNKLWKAHYGRLLLKLVEEDIFPDDIAREIEAYVAKGVRARDASLDLERVVGRYSNRPALPFLEDLAVGTVFMVRNSGPFIKGEKRRVRYYCRKVGTQKYYAVSMLARVRIVEN